MRVDAEQHQVAVGEQGAEAALGAVLSLSGVGIRALAVEQPGQQAGRDGQPAEPEQRAAPAERLGPSGGTTSPMMTPASATPVCLMPIAMPRRRVGNQ